MCVYLCVGAQYIHYCHCVVCCAVCECVPARVCIGPTDVLAYNVITTLFECVCVYVCVLFKLPTANFVLRISIHQGAVSFQTVLPQPKAGRNRIAIRDRVFKHKPERNTHGD